MLKVFLDATILFSAAFSAKRASRELLRLAQQGKVDLVTSQIAITETERNLATKSDEGLLLFQVLMERLPITVLENPSRIAVEQAAKYTALKDAPIVAGAIEAEADYLATFDRKHLINPPEVAANANITIATAGTVLEAVKHALE